MSNLKKLLVMSASIAAIGLVGGFSVFADCEDEDTYVCEEQTDFDLDKNQDLEEDQYLDDEEDPFGFMVGEAIEKFAPKVVKAPLGFVNGVLNVMDSLSIQTITAEEEAEMIARNTQLPEPPAMTNGNNDPLNQ